MRDGTPLTSDKLSAFSHAVQFQHGPVLQEMEYRGVWSEDISARANR